LIHTFPGGYIIKKKNIAIIGIIIYLLIGFTFTILRSNSYYEHFTVDLNEDGQTYWDNRCIEENRERPVPFAQWCLDGAGRFYTEAPSRFSWYFILYSKKISDYFLVIFLWPLHLLGFDLISFTGVGSYA